MLLWYPHPWGSCGHRGSPMDGGAGGSSGPPAVAAAALGSAAPALALS